MGLRVLRAKLLTVRALSTVLLILAVVRPAAAQYPGSRGDYYTDGWYLSGASATLRAASMSDRASAATWVMEKAKLVSGGVEYGRADRAFGVRAATGMVPMSFEGASCLGCAAEVRATSVLATYRRANPLFNTGALQIIELSAGAMIWDSLKGRGGPVLPTIGRQMDFSYGISIGAGLPLGDRLEVNVMYDVQQMRHPAARLSSGAMAGSGALGLATIRMGARWRLAAP